MLERKRAEQLIVSAFEDFRQNGGMLFINADDLQNGPEMTAMIAVMRQLNPLIDNIANLHLDVFNLVYKAVEKLSEIRRLAGIKNSIPKEKLGEALVLFGEIENCLTNVEQFLDTKNKLGQLGGDEQSKPNQERGGINPLLKYMESFSPKDWEDYQPRYGAVETQLDLKARSVGIYHEKAKNVLRLLATIFQDLERSFGDGVEANPESFLGILVLLEKALNIQKTVYRGASRGVAEDIFSQLNDLENKEAEHLKQRWQQIVEAVDMEAQKSERAKDPKFNQPYSEEKKAMMREIIDRFGNLDLNGEQTEAILDLLENVLNVQTTGNSRVSRLRRGGSRNMQPTRSI